MLYYNNMELQQSVYQFIPGKTRQSSGGWLSFNCPCCVDQGEARSDTRMRGGLKNEGDLVSYHCFNCGITASHRKGQVINKNFVKFMRLLGVPESEIKRLQIESIREKELSEGPWVFKSRTQTTRIPSFAGMELPDIQKSLEDVLNKVAPPESAIMAAKYLLDRGVYDFVDTYWSSAFGFKNRIIFPFTQGDRVVGYTGRDFTGKSESKYMTKQPKDFLYNSDKIKEDKEFLIIVEGTIDAAVLDCVAIMSNEASQKQIDYINQFKGEVIVCPDRDNAGKKLIYQAQENGWSVSFPIWEEHIKDACDSVKEYGKLYTLKSIIDGRISNSTKISVKTRIM